MGKTRNPRCRKTIECIPCVKKGCMFAGYETFPCRDGWNDIEGDFPINPPAMTVADCLEVLETSFSTSSPGTYYNTSTNVLVPTTAAVVVATGPSWCAVTCMCVLGAYIAKKLFDTGRSIYKWCKKSATRPDRIRFPIRPYYKVQAETVCSSRLS